LVGEQGDYLIGLVSLYFVFLTLFSPPLKFGFCFVKVLFFLWLWFLTSDNQPGEFENRGLIGLGKFLSGGDFFRLLARGKWRWLRLGLINQFGLER